MEFIFYRGNATNIQNAEKVFHTANIYCENDNRVVKMPKMCVFWKKKPLYIWGWLAIIVMISDVRGKYPVYYFTYDRTYY